MTSPQFPIRSAIIGFVILVALVLAIPAIFPPNIPEITRVTSSVSAVPHAFVVSRAAIPPIDAFPHVTLTKLISPTRQLEVKNAVSLTLDLSYVVIDRDAETPPHILLNTSEAIYIVSGSARVHANGSIVDATAGHAVFIPRDTVQSIVNTGTSPLVYVSILNPFYTEKTEIGIDTNTTAGVSRDIVPLRLWRSNETDPGVYFDRLVLYLIISPTATDRQGLNVTVPYSWGYVTIPEGGGSLPHILKSTSEVIYVISGSATARVGNDSFPLKAGDTLYIPKDTVQAVTNTGQGSLEYLMLLDPYLRPETNVNA